VRLEGLQDTFVQATGEHPVGWESVWSGCLAMIREPVEAPDLAYDHVLLEISAAFPPYSDYSDALLTRRIGFSAPNSASNSYVALLVVSAKWDPIDVGRLTTLTGRGPSTYEHDPHQALEDFISEVERSQVVQKLKLADAAFRSCDVHYVPPHELD